MQLLSGIGYVDKLLFTKHLATMLKAGINVSESIEVLIDQVESRKFRQILEVILKDVRNGQSFYDALRKHPKVFDNFYLGLIKVGEEGGTLQQNIEYLVKQMDKSYTLKKKIKGAMLYPAFILFVAVAIGGFIAFFLLPKLVEFFDNFETELPLATKVLLGLANVLKNYGIFVLIGIVVFVLGFLFLIQSKPIKPLWHKFTMNMPLVGKLVRYNQLATFTRNFGILIKSGVPMSTSLKTAANTLTNIQYHDKFLEIHDHFLKGKNIAQSVERLGMNGIPPLVVKMIDVGEKTGQLDQALIYLADFFDEEIDNITKNLTVVIEPVLLVVIGVAIAFVALSIITPIYDLTGSIR